jgi:hypothetical protein
MHLTFACGSRLDFNQPFPVLRDEAQRDRFLGVAAAMEVDGLRCARKQRAVPNGWSIAVSLRNERNRAVRLESMTAFNLTAFESGLLPSLETMEVFRLARQKNDIPGLFRPALADDRLEDALFCSSEIKAGDGISWDAFGSGAALPCCFEADPLMVFIEPSSGKSLLIGFAGQSRHLNTISLRTDDARRQVTELSATALFDGAVVSPGETRTSHELLVLYGDNTQELIRQYADYVADHHRHPQPSPTGKLSVYCTWYFYALDFNEADLAENLTSLREHPVPFDVFLLDDGWMTTYGDWEAHPERFKSGMVQAARKIREAGFIPGIWTCPFVIAQNADILTSYPDIILRNAKGEPCFFDCEKGKSYILDPFAPDAEKYVTGFYRRLREWGYSYHKLDFLRSIFNHADAAFADPSKNRAEAYRKGLELVRKGTGNDAVIAACGGLFEGSIGLCDINRSGADVRGHWNPEGKRLNGYDVRIKQILSRNVYNRFWHCDPDALQLRRRTDCFRGNEKRRHLAMGVFTDEEAFSTVVYQFLNGGIACASDKLADLDADRRALYRHVMPQYAPPARWLAWKSYLPDRLLTTFDTPGNGLKPYQVLTLANWSDEPARKILAPAHLPGNAGNRLAVFEFKEQKYHGIFQTDDSLTAELPPHSCRVFRLTNWDAKSPTLIGTDLNLAMGMELARWQAHDEAVSGCIDTSWEHPVRLTIALPEPGGGTRIKILEIPAGAKEFAMQSHTFDGVCEARNSLS